MMLTFQLLCCSHHQSNDEGCSIAAKMSAPFCCFSIKVSSVGFLGNITTNNEIHRNIYIYFLFLFFPLHTSTPTFGVPSSPLPLLNILNPPLSSVCVVCLWYVLRAPPLCHLCLFCVDTDVDNINKLVSRVMLSQTEQNR